MNQTATYCKNEEKLASLSEQNCSKEHCNHFTTKALLSDRVFYMWRKAAAELAKYLELRGLNTCVKGLFRCITDLNMSEEIKTLQPEKFRANLVIPLSDLKNTTYNHTILPQAKHKCTPQVNLRTTKSNTDL